MKQQTQTYVDYNICQKLTITNFAQALKIGRSKITINYILCEAIECLGMQDCFSEHHQKCPQNSRRKNFKLV